MVACLPADRARPATSSRTGVRRIRTHGRSGSLQGNRLRLPTASFTVTSAMFTYACTMTSKIHRAPVAGSMLRSFWAGFELRHTDAASGV